MSVTPQSPGTLRLPNTNSVLPSKLHQNGTALSLSFATNRNLPVARAMHPKGANGKGTPESGQDNFGGIIRQFKWRLLSRGARGCSRGRRPHSNGGKAVLPRGQRPPTPGAGPGASPPRVGGDFSMEGKRSYLSGGTLPWNGFIDGGGWLAGGRERPAGSPRREAHIRCISQSGPSSPAVLSRRETHHSPLDERYLYFFKFLRRHIHFACSI